MRSNKKNVREAVKKLLKSGHLFAFEEPGVNPVITHWELKFEDSSPILHVPFPEKALGNPHCQNQTAYYFYGIAFGLRRASDQIHWEESYRGVIDQICKDQEGLPPNVYPTHLLTVENSVHREKSANFYKISLFLLGV